MAIDWNAEEAQIKERWTENQNEIGQTERQRDEIIQRYDDRLSVLYTEGVTLNGEARFARRMKAEQEARHEETQQASDSASPDDSNEQAGATGDGAAPETATTTDTPLPTPCDISVEAPGTEAASA